jgi:hypothetical protein
MIKNLCITLLSAILTFSSFKSLAESQLITPNKCPGINSIRSEGLQDVIERTHGKWFGQNTSYYDTNGEWVFLIAWFISSTYEDALKQSKQALIQLSGNPTPIKDIDNSSGYDFDWICIYQTNTNLTAIAGVWDLDKTSNKLSHDIAPSGK